MADKEKMNEPAYSKNALLKSEKYAGYADILTVVLDDDNVLYTKSEVERALKNYLNNPRQYFNSLPTFNGLRLAGTDCHRITKVKKALTTDIKDIPNDNYYILKATCGGSPSLEAYLPIPLKTSSVTYMEGAKEVLYDY